MVTATKRKLSESTDGKPILSAATATPGTAIHTAVSGTTPGTFDEIWLWVHNTSASTAVLLTSNSGEQPHLTRISSVSHCKTGIVSGSSRADPPKRCDS